MGAGQYAHTVPLPVPVLPVRAPQGVPAAAEPVRAGDAAAAEPGADPHQRAGRLQPHARVAAARAAGAVHVPRGARGGRQAAGAGRPRPLPGPDLPARPLLLHTAADASRRG